MSMLEGRGLNVGSSFRYVKPPNNVDIHTNSVIHPVSSRYKIAAPCGPSNYEKLHIRAMDQYLDMWNLMAYGIFVA